MRCRNLLLMGGVLVMVVAGCGDDEGGEPVTTTTGAERPEGPSADLSEEVTGGGNAFIGELEPWTDRDGYVQEEVVAAGIATAYEPVAQPVDGRWVLEPASEADYRTRVLVRRPANPEDFSGVVLVEWHNVSGGVDANPGFANLQEEILRQGHAWVGVSTQSIGVQGGDVAVDVGEAGQGILGLGLRGVDPERYGSLEHPGDRYAFDIYAQVAAAVRGGGGPLGDLEPTSVVAMGQSQAAFALTSFVNGVQPLTRAFDGFLLHSRGAEGLPVARDVAVDAEAAATVDEAEAAATADEADGVILRTDTEVPVIVLQSETDVGLLGSARARQPDTDTIRTWEVAGTAHADRRVLSQEIAASLGCPGEVNDGPMHVVAKAALRRLVEWVQDGSSAPGAEPLALTGDDGDTGGRDDLGIALGGVRTPPVDVPTRVLSGEPPEGASLICSLSGSTTPIAEADLADRYGSRADFEAQYAAALDDAIEAGFVLEEDRAAIEDYAHPELVPE